jgi:predicted nucleotidyltransferase
MRLTPGELFCGVAPELIKCCAKELRWKEGFGISLVCESLGASNREAMPVLASLVRDGYAIDLSDGQYSATEKMSRLAMATISTGLPRADATKLLNDVVKRAKEVNSGKRVSDGGVAKLAVFGSYLDDSKLILGDLDLAYEWKRGVAHPEAKRIPRVRKVLAAGNPLISIHDLDELEARDWPHRIIYDSTKE